MLLDTCVRVCPKCNAEFQRTELMSYSSFGSSEIWSDGHNDSLYAAEAMSVPFARCPLCNRLIWIEDAEVVRDSIPENLNGIPRMDYPSGDLALNPQKTLRKDALRLLDDTKLSTERQLSLHLLIWRNINDDYRKFRNLLRTFGLREALKTRRHAMALKKTKRKCMTQALNLINEIQNSDKPLFDEQEELMLKIELLRESGHFSQAKKLLRTAGTKLNSYPDFVKKTQKALLFRNKKVFRI
jgi:hypothetical protein